MATSIDSQRMEIIILNCVPFNRIHLHLTIIARNERFDRLDGSLVVFEDAVVDLVQQEHHRLHSLSDWVNEFHDR